MARFSGGAGPSAPSATPSGVSGFAFLNSRFGDTVAVLNRMGHGVPPPSAPVGPGALALPFSGDVAPAPCVGSSGGVASGSGDSALASGGLPQLLSASSPQDPSSSDLGDPEDFEGFAGVPPSPRLIHDPRFRGLFDYSVGSRALPSRGEVEFPGLVSPCRSSLASPSPLPRPVVSGLGSPPRDAGRVSGVVSDPPPPLARAPIASGSVAPRGGSGSLGVSASALSGAAPGFSAPAPGFSDPAPAEVDAGLPLGLAPASLRAPRLRAPRLALCSQAPRLTLRPRAPRLSLRLRALRPDSRHRRLDFRILRLLRSMLACRSASRLPGLRAPHLA